MKSPIFKLIARIENTPSAEVSIKDVRVLAKSNDPDAIGALAGLLDDDGRVGREAARALARFGREAESTLRRCMQSHNETVLAHATQLLAALGDLPEEPAVEDLEVVADNDNQEAPRGDLALVADAEVTRCIAGTLHTRGVALVDIEDGVAEVQTRILEMLRVGPAPTDLSEWRTLGSVVATAFAIDLARRRKIQPKVEEDSSDDLDGYVDDRGDPLWDPVDAKRMVGVFVEMLEAGELPNFSGEILQGNVAGWTDAHIGHELGLSGVTVAEHRRIVRRKFEKRLRELEMGDLIPRRRKEQDSGREAADTDDLPASVPTRR